MTSGSTVKPGGTAQRLQGGDLGNQGFTRTYTQQLGFEGALVCTKHGISWPWVKEVQTVAHDRDLCMLENDVPTVTMHQIPIPFTPSTCTDYVIGQNAGTLLNT